MRVAWIFILLSGFFVSGYSVVSYGRADARFVSVLNEVSSLNESTNAEQADGAAKRIADELNAVNSYFGPLLLAGIGIVFLGIIGLIVEIKSIDRSHENEIEGYKLTRAR